MVDYRVYFLTADNHIERGEGFTATSDDDAKIRAAGIAKDAPYELWCRERLVMKVPPKRPQR